MKKEFPGYFSGAAADVEKIWDECIFVLDANVLLNLYRYSDFTCSKLLEVFTSLADRLWVPHQVVFEYLNNRLSVIGEQGKVYDDAVKKVDALKRSLENHNQHPFVTEQTLAEGLELFAKIVSELNQNKLVYEKRINTDEIKDQLERLLEGKVGSSFAREQLDKIIVDGKGRYEQKIPPGFCDVKKGGDSIVFTDVCRPYGDYIVWLQIIEHAKSLNKSVIFITGDSKDDWWASFQGKTLGPHPQLVEEFLSLVGKEFYMYLPDRFLERASEYLKQDASEQAVNEIRDIREEDSESALLDKAVNFAWPSKPGNTWPDKPAPSSWNDAPSSWPDAPAIATWSDVSPAKFAWPMPDEGRQNYEIHWIEAQRSQVRERAVQIRERLDSLLKEREQLAILQHKLVGEGAGPADEALQDTLRRLAILNSIIDVLESELSEMRAKLRSLSLRQRILFKNGSEE